VMIAAGVLFKAAPQNLDAEESKKYTPVAVSEEDLIVQPELKSNKCYQLYSLPALPEALYVEAPQASKTIQFYQAWLNLVLNATAGIAFLGVAKNILYEVYSHSLPSIVTPGFCTNYVALLSLFNGVGRIFWAAVSDRIGRKLTFQLFFCLGCVIYSFIPFLARYSGEEWSLWSFIILTIIAITIYGGGFAIIPAYASDLFGTKQVGVIYSKILTAWSVSGLIGPTLLAFLRRQSEVNAIVSLSSKIDPVKFSETFGVDVKDVAQLIDSNMIDIAKLLPLLADKDEVSDPTSTLYDTTMYCMAVLLFIGALNNSFISPVSKDYVIADKVPGSPTDVELTTNVE
jgi:Major Facilitator Superfamily